jgi:hypothetical protein
MIDWADYFLFPSAMKKQAKEKTADFSLFEAPPPKPKKPELPKEEPKSKSPKEEKKPESPKGSEPPAFSLFDAPPEPASLVIPPVAPSEPTKPKKPTKPDKWDQFLELFYEGGKKKVPNPNPKTKKKYPEVQTDTALKDQVFHGKLMKEYEAWLAQGAEEKDEKLQEALEHEKKIKTHMKAEEEAEAKAKERWPPTDPTKVDWKSPAVAHVVAKAKELGPISKIPLIKWMRGEDSPWSPEPIVGSPLAYKLGLMEAKILAEAILSSLFHSKKKKPKAWPSRTPGELDYTQPEFSEAVAKAKEFKQQKINLVQWLRKSEDSPWAPSGSEPPAKLSISDAVALAEDLYAYVGYSPTGKPEKKEPAHPEKKEPAHPEKKEPAHPKPKKGTHIQKPEEAKVGDTITWEHEGKTHTGRVTDVEGNRFYVQTADPKTGEIMDLYVLAQYDLDRLPVAKIEDDEFFKKFKTPTVPPKPEEPDLPEMPDLPEPPEIPSKKSISKPSDVEIGDYLEWDAFGNTYRGKVVSFEEDGRFRAEVQYPPGSKAIGKTPSFDEKKITDRKARIYDPSVMGEYEEKLAEHKKKVDEIKAKHQKKVSEIQAKHQKEVEAWEAEKAKIEGKKHTAKRPIEREHLIQTPEAWNSDHPIMVQAKALVPEYAEKYKQFLEDTQKKLKKLIQTPPFMIGAVKKMWKESPDSEKMLTMGGHFYGYKFFTDVLTNEEKDALSSAVEEWQQNPKHYGGQKLLGALNGMGVEGQKKKHDTDVDEAREAGKKDEILQSAIAKAIAYSQAVFDSLGVEHITLYRGGKNAAVGAASQGDLVPMPNSRELTGFSASPSTAFGFGKYRMKARVPVSRVFISPVTVPHLGGPDSGSGYDENEFLIAGLAGEKVKRMGDSILDYDEKLMKMASRVVYGTAVDEDEEDDLGWHKHMQKVRERAKKREEDKKASSRLAKLTVDYPGFRETLLTEVRELLATSDFPSESRT